MIFRKIINGLVNALRGVARAYRVDMSIRIEVWAGLIVLGLVFYFFWPLWQVEFLFLILGLALVLITELINTALERALERLHPERHELIGESKDIASAAVLVSIIFTLAVLAAIVVNHWFEASSVF